VSDFSDKSGTGFFLNNGCKTSLLLYHFTNSPKDSQQCITFLVPVFVTMFDLINFVYSHEYRKQLQLLSCNFQNTPCAKKWDSHSLEYLNIVQL